MSFCAQQRSWLYCLSFEDIWEHLLILNFRAGRVAQGVKCLPSKCEALSSNHIATKKTNKKKKLLAIFGLLMSMI
jgi:hypothetical protein